MPRDVLIFARLRELCAAPTVRLRLPEPATVADLRADLARRFPEAAGLIARCGVAVDQRIAADADPLPPGAELAVIPPVSGG